MKIEYDSERDLLYIYFSELEIKASKTVTVSPGIHADLIEMASSWVSK